MSVFYVAQWSVAEPDHAACEEAVVRLAEHVRSAHPGIRTVRTLRQAWGPLPRRAYIWVEEFESLSAMDAEPETPECNAAWQPIHDLSLAATFTGSVWTDPQRAVWFEN